VTGNGVERIVDDLLDGWTPARRAALDDWLADLPYRMVDGDRAAVEEALWFLERDPYFFRSGYARERVARYVAQADLTEGDRDRARAIVLTSVDGARHCPHPGLGRLARAVADNPLRRALRERLYARELAVRCRALRTIVDVRRPGLTPDDLAAAREQVLADAGRGTWLSATVRRLAIHLWTPEWEADLRALLPRHGPDRKAAKRLVEDAERRRARRERRAGP
jgi:hypothetical protein